MRPLAFLALLSITTLAFAFSLDINSEQVNFLGYPAGTERKKAFISYLKPLIEEKNQSLLNDRQKLIRLSKKIKLNIREQRWLKHINQHYNGDGLHKGDDSIWSVLLSKIDLIPTSLAIAQGAKESGWGTSRFAQQGNNYFGQWCSVSGCGIVPNNRNQGANHEVAKYKSVQESVTTYINNLNRNPAYKKLREIREQLRKTGKAISGYDLAHGLQNYSERGTDYVKEIQSLIINNNLDDLQRQKL